MYVLTYTVHKLWPILSKIWVYEYIILKIFEVRSNLTVPYFLHSGGQKGIHICGRFGTIAKSVYYLRHVSPSVNMFPLERFFLKFDNWGIFFRKYVDKIRMWLKSVKSIGQFTWRAKYVLFFPAKLNCHKRSLLEYSGTRLVGYLRRNKHYTNAVKC